MVVNKPIVNVEFFGIPRQRAGIDRLTVSAANISELLQKLVIEFPQFNGLVNSDGQLAKEYLLAVNRERFVGNLQEPLNPDENLIILSADAGG